MHEWDWVIHVRNLKDHGFDNNVLWEIHKKRPHDTNVVENIAIYVFRKKSPSFVLIQTLY